MLKARKNKFIQNAKYIPIDPRIGHTISIAIIIKKIDEKTKKIFFIEIFSSIFFKKFIKIFSFIFIFKCLLTQINVNIKNDSM